MKEAGHPASAIDLLQSVLTYKEKVFGHNSEDVADVFYNSAELHLSIAKYAEVISIYTNSKLKNRQNDISTSV